MTKAERQAELERAEREVARLRASDAAADEASTKDSGGKLDDAMSSRKSAEVFTKIDDTLTSLRHTIEGVKERQADELKAVGEKVSTFERVFDRYDQRLQYLEDRGLNPGGARQWTSEIDAADSRRRTIGEWLRMNYGVTTIARVMTSEAGAEWRANQTESDDDKGGYLVPTPLLPEVMRIIQTFGSARRICRTIPMTRQKLDLTKKLAGPSVYWVDEGSAGTPSGATFARAQLEAKKLMALDEISMEVDDDATLDLAVYLIELFGEAVAEEEDTQAFNSTSPFTGLLQTSGVPTHVITSTTFTGNLTYDDFVDLMHAPNAHVVRNGMFLFSTDVFAEIQKIKSSDGWPLFNQNLAAGAPPTILGRPYELSEVMPKTADDGSDVPVCAYGDFRRLLIGDRRRITIDFSTHAAWTTAGESMRLIERVGFVTAIPTAFAIMKTT